MRRALCQLSYASMGGGQDCDLTAAASGPTDTVAPSRLLRPGLPYPVDEQGD